MRKQEKKGWAALLAILFVVVLVSGGSQLSRQLPKQQAPSLKVEQKTPELTPEELEAKRLAEEKQIAEREAKRQQEAERQRVLAEERAAREAERAATRLTVAEFEGLFLDKVGNIFRTMGVADYATMGKPARYVNGANETLIYPLDEIGDLKMKVYAKNGGVTGLTVSTDNVSRETLFTVSILYNVAALQVLSMPSELEANNILQALSLNENIFNDLSKPQSITINGYHYSKSSSGKNFLLSATEQ